MKFVVASVDRQVAWRKLHRRGLARRLRELLGARPAEARLELLWLPHYFVRFAFTQGEKRGEILVMASAHDGSAALVDERGLAFEDAPARERFPATIEPAAAIDAAHRVLLAARSRGPLWQAAKLDVKPGVAELVHYPYWAYYSRGATGILDVSLLDAWTGQQAGGRAKAALLSALAAHERARGA